MFCKWCGMESETSDVCSWCGQALSSAASRPPVQTASSAGPPAVAPPAPSAPSAPAARVPEESRRLGGFAEDDDAYEFIGPPPFARQAPKPAAELDADDLPPAPIRPVQAKV